MRIVFLSPYVPYPVRHGGHNRTLGLLRCLSRFASVQVLAVGDPHAEEQERAREVLRGFGASLEVFPATGPGLPEADAADVERLPDATSHFRSPWLSEALQRTMEASPPDVVHFEELVMAQYLSQVPVPRVVDRQKVEYLYHDAMAERGEALFHRREAARFRRWEGSLAGSFERIVVIGESDARVLAGVHGAERVEVLPISVSESIRRPPNRTAAVSHVLLYGSLDYPPNVEAHDFYFREVWPILRLGSDLRTIVVGSGSPPPGLGGGDERVEIRGYVSDISAELVKPGVLLIPLGIGGGARTKIQEALAAGMPVVSTGIGVENLGLQAGRHFLSAETALEMADAVLRLAGDPALVAALSREGAAFADARFREDVLAPQIESIFREAAAARAVPRARAGSDPYWGWEREGLVNECLRLRMENEALRRAWGLRVELWLRRKLGRGSVPFEALRKLKHAVVRVLRAIRERGNKPAGS